MVLDVGRVKHLGDLMHKSIGSNGLAIPSNWRLSADGLQNVVWTPETPAGTPSLSYGSNANDVGSVGAAGGSSNVTRADHVHRGVRTITSNGSNGLFGDVNLAAGAGIGLGVTGQTVTITNIAGASAGGGSGTNLTIEEVDGSPTVAATKLVLPNGTLGVVGTVATYTPAGGGGSGWPPTFPSAPTVVESVDWTSASSSQAISLANTPQTGDIIFMAQTSNQFEAALPTGGGATWKLVHAEGAYAGAYAPIYIWMGIVGGSPSASCTANWASSNQQAVALMNVRGLTGVVERSIGRSAVNNSVVTGSVGYLAPMLPILSPFCIAVGYIRAGSTLTIGGGFTVAEGANPVAGYCSLAYKMTTQLENVAPTWVVDTSAWTLCAALVY